MSTLRIVLSLEQAAIVAAEIEAWKELHAANDASVLPNESADTIIARQLRWKAAKLVEFAQLAEIDEIECYFVKLMFPESIPAAFVLKRLRFGMIHVKTYTFWPPDFTHIAQEGTGD